MLSTSVLDACSCIEGVYHVFSSGQKRVALASSRLSFGSSDEELEEAEDQTDETQAEDMIQFLAGYSTDLLGTIMAPIGMIFLLVMYYESKILSQYNVTERYTTFYILFSFVMIVFQVTESARACSYFLGWEVVLGTENLSN